MKILEKLFVNIVIISALFSCKHPSNTEDVLLENLYKDSVYLIFRGTESKEGGLAKKFNLHHKDVSHVGILLYNQNHWTVYHVMNDFSKESSFHSEKIESFLDKTKENIDYISIYHAIPFDKKIIQNRIDEVSKNNIKFNYTFSDNENELYCTQFVIKTLQNSTHKFLSYKKHITNLQHRIVIKKDTIDYYPVDMFFEDNRFQKKFEWFAKY